MKKLKWMMGAGCESKKKITLKFITANIKKFYGKFVSVKENWTASVYYLICRQRKHSVL